MLKEIVTEQEVSEVTVSPGKIWKMPVIGVNRVWVSAGEVGVVFYPQPPSRHGSAMHFVKPLVMGESILSRHGFIVAAETAVIKVSGPLDSVPSALVRKDQAMAAEWAGMAPQQIPVRTSFILKTLYQIHGRYLPYSQDELAQLIGASRERINKLIASMKRRGIVATEVGGVGRQNRILEILDPTKL